MSVQTIDSIKQQANDLSVQELRELANYFSKLVNKTLKKPQSSPNKNDKQLEWLKANRDKYANQYVALDGDKLIAHAETLQEIRQRTKDKTNLFIIKVFAEETVVSAGL
jgi:hypothetical protein